MSELLKLAEACEKAEGPSRELDDAIALAVRWDAKGSYPESPAYTSSLDAALALVSENFSYELTFSAAGEGAMRRARLWDWRRGPTMIDPDNEWEALGRTLPLALCAAALRVRDAERQRPSRIDTA